jgi:1,4-alpha-glucan branching enzyme
MMFRITIVLCAMLSMALQAWTQDPYRIEGENIVLQLNRNMPLHEQERLLEISGLKGLSLDSLWNFSTLGHWQKEGWKLHAQGKTICKIYKPIASLSGDIKLSKDGVVLSDLRDVIAQQVRATFGVNNFRRLSVQTIGNGRVRFFLPDQVQARDVILAGTFNSWSTSQTHMIKTDSGWVYDVPLKAGKHCYKFIIDGHWIHDRENLNREDDLYGGYNSVYYVTNYEFRLKGYRDAKEVMLSGSFNDWNERKVKMQRATDGWSVMAYLAEGTHEYKFIVDGRWIRDPMNAVSRTDGKGNVNSVISIGDVIRFKVEGFKDTNAMMVAGDFNGWRPGELKMNKTSTGWELPYVLGPGNYQYKFIADGNWFIDPENPHTGTDRGHVNSLLVVEPTHSFLLRGYASARDVMIAGNFSDWRPYRMKKTAEGWVIDLYLKPGKCLYKFVVDGQWILDPSNNLWEENRFGTGNSVLWLGQQR